MNILIGTHQEKNATILQDYILHACEAVDQTEVVSVHWLNTGFSVMDYTEKESVDLLFLEIEFGTEDGIALAQKIQKRNNKIKIVFLSKKLDRIEDIFSIIPFHFLSVPTTQEKVNVVIRKAVLALKDEDKNIITVRNRDGVFMIHLYDILYVQSEKRYLYIYTQSLGVIRVIMTMAEMEQKTYGRLFRCHRSYFINLLKVEVFKNGYAQMMDRKEIPVSSGKYKELEAMLYLYA